jgi:hypothetical protein
MKVCCACHATVDARGGEKIDFAREFAQLEIVRRLIIDFTRSEAEQLNRCSGDNLGKCVNCPHAVVM